MGPKKSKVEVYKYKYKLTYPTIVARLYKRKSHEAISDDRR
jgi:hypothetical protein